MSSIVKSLSQAGLQYADGEPARRGILLSNQINLILFGLSIILFLFYWAYYPINIITPVIPAIGVLCMGFVWANHLGFLKIGRIGTSIFIPLATTSLSIFSKNIYYESQADLDYFTFRFLILGASIIPAILFTTRERVLLISCLLFNLVLLLGHDPLHALFGVGYIKNGIDPYYYYFANVIIAVTYTVLLGSILFLKINLERADRKNLRLIEQEKFTNNELKIKNEEIALQHQELLAQSEKLANNQQKLLDAQALIEEQKEMLSFRNKNLQSELIEKNKDLSEANAELIKYNNELRQFSYTISHNLRGPVASLLGLVQLFHMQENKSENKTISQHILESTERLDAIIKDLSKIIDIRNDIFKIRQKISLHHEINQIKKVFEKELDKHFITIETDIEDCPHLYSVRPMVHSILYNLISNAIKYKAPERRTIIKVTAKSTNQQYVLAIEDNGLGIDMVRHKENLFKLYKRFHYHTEGKGLGLYLVKLQSEALGGYVEVESELNRFTRFIVYLRKPENIERQVLFNKPYATIFFDASINATGIIWRGPLTSEQYKEVFLQSLDFVKAFNTPNYIADISNQGPVSEVDQQWMFNTVMPEAIQFGMRRIASVKPNIDHQLIVQYLDGINFTLSKLGATYKILDSMDAATNWMQTENENDLSKINLA